MVAALSSTLQPSRACAASPSNLCTMNAPSTHDCSRITRGCRSFRPFLGGGCAASCAAKAYVWTVRAELHDLYNTTTSRRISHLSVREPLLKPACRARNRPHAPCRNCLRKPPFQDGKSSNASSCPTCQDVKSSHASVVASVGLTFTHRRRTAWYFPTLRLLRTRDGRRAGGRRRRHADHIEALY